jgi:hypothetical protein
MGVAEGFWSAADGDVVVCGFAALLDGDCAKAVMQSERRSACAALYGSRAAATCIDLTVLSLYMTQRDSKQIAVRRVQKKLS